MIKFKCRMISLKSSRLLGNLRAKKLRNSRRSMKNVRVNQDQGLIIRRISSRRLSRNIEIKASKNKSLRLRSKI